MILEHLHTVLSAQAVGQWDTSSFPRAISTSITRPSPGNGQSRGGDDEDSDGDDNDGDNGGDDGSNAADVMMVIMVNMIMIMMMALCSIWVGLIHPPQQYQCTVHFPVIG